MEATGIPRDVRLANLAMSVAFCGLGILWIVESLRIPARQTISQVSPGFLPLWAGILVLAIAVVILIKHLMMRPRAIETPMVSLPGMARIAIAVVALFAYVALLPHLHYFLNSWLVIAITLALFGQRSPVGLLVSSTVIAALLSLLFLVLLGLALPGGRFG